MKVIGLTGGIGTGKTEVSGILHDLGAEVISADTMGHEVYRRGSDGWRLVAEAFGEGVLGPDSEVDRGKLGAIVFGDERQLKRLNAIVHPRIRSMVGGRIKELQHRRTQVVVVEAALLVEAGWDDLVEEVWVTIAAEDVTVERVGGRGSLDPEAIRARIRTQMPQSERVAHADVIIENSGSLDDLRDRVLEVWKERI